MSGGRVVARLFCDRPTRAHALARAVVDDDGTRAVEVREAVQHSRGVRGAWRRVPLDDLDGMAAELVTATCGCGDRYVLDLVAVARVRPGPVRRVAPPRDTPGVAYNRL